MKQCNQLNPKCEKSNRTSDQFLQQIGKKREDLGEKEKRKNEKHKEKDIFQVKKKKDLKAETI